VAAVAPHAIERRCEARLPGGGGRWAASAFLRPGLAIVLINISSRGALVESASRLRPGAATELQLHGGDERGRVSGRLERCHVSRLQPLRYRGVVLFDAPLDVAGDSHGQEVAGSE
jgi:hypothetical protein